MNDAEARLAAFWRADRPSAPDAVFRLAVLERRARRRFHVAVAWVSASGASVVAATALLVPSLPVWTPSQATLAALPLLSVVATCACMMWAFLRGRESF